MDITFPVSATTQLYTPPTTTTTTTTAKGQVPIYQPQPAQQTQQGVASNASNPDTADNIQTQYLQALQQAALSFKNSYPLGDQQFSIFKDATGQYITRYVSLIDGSVTYVPQPVLVRPASASISPAISIQA